MTEMIKQIEKKKFLFLALILVAGAAMYMVSLTHSALWFDEAIEYFYSKELVGETPGGYGLTNMYQRICCTYQPPLYNVLMYLWLLLFDFGEASFRLFGVLVTLAGAAGIFMCVYRLCGTAFASIGALVYLFSPGVAYYALECGEYYLMLSCLCWTLYFFICAIQDAKPKYLCGFFVFACLAVYSQYGAAFPVLVMYLILAVRGFRTHSGRKPLLICTGVTAFAAVAPLVIFFLIPQMDHQGSVTVSHIPVFQDNFIVDFIRGIISVLMITFRTKRVFIFQNGMLHGIIGCIPFVIACAACLLSVFLLFKRNKTFYILALSCALTYIIYFMAVVCSFYAYNNNGTRLLGNRYALFFAPLFVVTLTYSCHELLKEFKNKKWKSVCAAIMLLSLFAFCLVEVFILFIGWEKDDVRGVTDAWFETDAQETLTLVHEWCDANFQYYLRHDDRYNSSIQEKIKVDQPLKQTTDNLEIKNESSKSVIFSYDTLYYIGPTEGNLQQQGTEAFLSLMRECGYSVTEIYNNLSGLYYLERNP